MTFIAPFLAGLLAAFTPCVLVLFPAVVYRFTHTKKERLAKELSLFVISFISVFFVVALFLNQILSSTIKQGFQLGIGLLFVVLGILALTNRFNPLQFPLIKNPFLFGLLFAIIASVNPCSFAYLGIIATTQTPMIIFSFVLFAIGLIIPSILFALFGKALFRQANKTQKALKYISTLMNALLIVMGVYLMIKITYLGRADIFMAGLLLSLTFVVLLRSFYFFHTTISLSKIILLIALLGILLTAILHCDTHIAQNNAENNFVTFSQQSTPQPTCSAEINECSVCKRCTLLFGIATLLGFGAIIGNRFLEKKTFAH